jgi:hypothetical protein
MKLMTALSKSHDKDCYIHARQHSTNVRFNVVYKNESHIGGYWLFLIGCEGLKHEFDIGRYYDKLDPCIDVDIGYKHNLKIVGVDEF